ncbi:MAG: PKD domain-containing protein [Flavobacteriales bacterium]|nr:PKD domain-containing protein [Flavobacteriales bacterium]
MTRILIIIVCQSIALGASAQHPAQQWCFGIWAGVDFGCDPPFAYRTGMYYTVESCASISSLGGDLQFYTQGDSVYTAEHEMMPNGFAIGNAPNEFGSSTQGSLIVPQPGSNGIHLIFTVDCAEAQLANGLRYSVVDMTMNGGLGEVTSKSNLLHFPVTEKLAAVHHANEEDVWVLVHEYGTDAFLAYLVTSSGIQPPVVSNSGFVQYLPTDTACMARGYMKFSPDGERLVVLSSSDCHSFVAHPQLFHFDDATGQVSLDYTIDDPDSLMYYGASFSPNSGLLYMTTGWHYYPTLHQFDASAANSVDFLASKYVMADSASYDPLADQALAALQLAPNGKLYVAKYGYGMNAINQPDLQGAACDYEEDAVRPLYCTGMNFGLPNFIESYFRTFIQPVACAPDSIVADYSFGSPVGGICAGDTVQFNDLSTCHPEDVGQWDWDFDDPASMAADSSALQDPVHVFTTAGTYQVTLVAGIEGWTLACKSDTITLSVLVLPCGQGISEHEAHSVAVVDIDGLAALMARSCTIACHGLRLFDASGRLLLNTKSAQDLELWHSSAAIGVYLFRLGSGEAVQSGRLIVAE